MGDTGRGRRRHRSRADARRHRAWACRHRERDAGHAGHALPDRLDLEVVRRPGRSARGRGWPAQPAGAGHRLPALASAADSERAGHAAPPPLAQRRSPAWHGGDALHARRGPPAGPDRAGAPGRVLLLEPRLLARRPRARARQRQADRRRAPRERARPSRNGRHRAGDHERAAGAARRRLFGGRFLAPVASGAAARAGDLGRDRFGSRQHLRDRRGHGRLRAPAPERGRRRRQSLELRAHHDRRRRGRGRLRLRLRPLRRGARPRARDRSPGRDGRLQLRARGRRRAPGSVRSSCAT